VKTTSRWLERFVYQRAPVEADAQEAALLNAAIRLAADYGERGATPPQVLIHVTTGRFPRWSVGILEVN